MQSFCRSTSEFVILRVAKPRVIWHIHECSCKSFAKIVPIQKNYISGGLFGATMATLISFPFDVVRTRIVAQPTTNLKDPSSLYYTNTRNALIQIVNREGFFGLYKGILPRLLSIGPTSAINFAGYNTFTEIYYYLKQDQLNIAEKFLCGSLSGMF